LYTRRFKWRAAVVAYTEYRATKSGENAKHLRKKAGRYVKELREAAGLTQAQLAKQLGFEYYTFISQIETGLTRVPPDKLPLFAEALRVPLKEFALELLKHYDPHTHAAIT
jgi:DNA-binding XRE family transcriptional regulator